MNNSFINYFNELKAYHGTNKKFDSVNDNIHWVTTNADFAKEYASGAVVHRGGGEPIVYEHDINVNHPAIVSTDYSRITTLLTKWYEARPNKEIDKESILAAMNAIRSKWHDIGLDNSDTAVYNHWNMTGVDGNKLLIQFLELCGYDSIFYKENGADTYGVWGSNSKINESTIVERKSLDEKSTYIKMWSDEALELLRNGSYIVCHGLRMSYGNFYGVKCIGKYGEWGFKNIYYFGRVDSRGEWDSANAQGRADIIDSSGMEGRESCVYVNSNLIYEEVQALWEKYDFGFNIQSSELEGFDATDMIYAIGEHDKNILYHELSHIYDLWKRGLTGLKNTEKYKWISRPEELEAELNLLYNSILSDIDTYKSTEEFENKYPLTFSGLSRLSKDYGSDIGAFLDFARKNEGKVKIDYNKIVRRLIDLRNQVLLKIKDYSKTSNSDEQLKETPVWDDTNKDISKSMGMRSISKVFQIMNNSQLIKEFEFNGYKFLVFTNKAKGSLNIFILLDDIEIGEFSWYLTDNMWQTVSASVADKHQGKGLAYKAYTFAIDNYLNTLMSDYSLTGETGGKGSFDLWVKLGKTYQFKYLHDIRKPKNFQPVKEFTRDMMGDQNIRFVVSKTNLSRNNIMNSIHKEIDEKLIADQQAVHITESYKELFGLICESYGVETDKSGFEDDVGKPTESDMKKISDIVNDKKLPDVATDGNAYIVKWADGRGIFACKKKSYLSKWLEKTGSWAEIVSIKYENAKDKDLKVINEKLQQQISVDVNSLYSPSWKIKEVLMDLDKGNGSRTHAPINVSKIGKNKFYIMDGNHRVIEGIANGQKVFDATIDEYVPDMTKTGGSYNSFIEDAVQVTSIVKFNTINEGLIKFDTAPIRKWIDDHFAEIVQKIKETNKTGYQTHIDDHLVFKNEYSKKTKNIYIEIEDKIYDEKKYNDDDGTYHPILMQYSLHDGIISISASEFMKYSKNKIKEQIISGVIHELSHESDPGMLKKKKYGDTYGEYANADKETVAFFKEYIDNIKNLPKEKQDIILNKIRTKKLTGIKYIDNYLILLSDENLTKFIKYLYKELTGDIS
jgi:hypothetical protein